MKNSISLYFTFLLLFVAAALTAQIRVGLSGGLSLPVGNYHEYHSRALGNAAVGGQVGLDLHYTLHRNLALGIKSAYTLNPVDAVGMAEGIWNENKTAASVQVTATPYQLATAMFEVRPQTGCLFHRFSLFAGLSGGVLIVQSPRLTQKIALSSPLHQTIDGATSSTFAFQGEAGVQFRLGDRLGLDLFANYLSAKPTFEFVRSDQTGAPVEAEEWTVTAVNTGLRLSWLLSSKSSNNR